MINMNRRIVLKEKNAPQIELMKKYIAIHGRAKLYTRLTGKRWDVKYNNGIRKGQHWLHGRLKGIICLKPNEILYLLDTLLDRDIMSEI